KRIAANARRRNGTVSLFENDEKGRSAAREVRPIDKRVVGCVNVARPGVTLRAHRTDACPTRRAGASADDRREWETGAFGQDAADPPAAERLCHKAIATSEKWQVIYAGERKEMLHVKIRWAAFRAVILRVSLVRHEAGAFVRELVDALTETVIGLERQPF